MSTMSHHHPHLNIGKTFGAVYIGCIVSTVLYGFTCNQTYVYFKNYKKDTWKTKALVASLLILDTFQVALLIDITWSYLIVGHSRPQALNGLVWSFSLEVAITITVTFLVRSFYVMQLWTLGRRVLIIGPAMLFATGQLALGLKTSIDMFTSPSVHTVTNPRFVWILGSKCVCSVIADVIITAATCYYLHAARTGFSRSTVVINLLSLYTINRGVLAMVWEAIVMITFLTMPRNFIFAALHLMLGKLHAASLLALLNNRDNLRRQQNLESNTFSQVELRPRTPFETQTINVEVMVTSETVVTDEHPLAIEDDEKPRKDSLSIASETMAW